MHVYAGMFHIFCSQEKPEPAPKTLESWRAFFPAKAATTSVGRDAATASWQTAEASILAHETFTTDLSCFFIELGYACC